MSFSISRSSSGPHRKRRWGIWKLRVQSSAYPRGLCETSKFWRCPSTVSCTIPSGESPNLQWIPSWEPNQHSNLLKALLRGISVSEYSSEVFRVRLRRFSENGSVAYLVERPTRETRTKQYSDIVLHNLHHIHPTPPPPKKKQVALQSWGAKCPTEPEATKNSK